jgi:hypothetical protein
MTRPDLISNCSQCAALCCVATAFDAGTDFGFDKAAGERCRYLSGEQRCSIHARRHELGFAGCAIYDCHGAGQRVTRAFLSRRGEELERDRAFLALRSVHELLWLLSEASALCPREHSTLRTELAHELERLDALAYGPLPELVEIELGPHSARAHALLRRVGVALGGRTGLYALRKHSRPALG